MQRNTATPALSSFMIVKPAVWLLGGTVLLLALFCFRAPPASAQFYYQFPGFNAHYGASHSRHRRRYYRVRPRRGYHNQRAPRKAARAPKAKPSWYPDKSEKDPVQIIVSLPEQKARIYQGEKLLVTSRVSSGKRGYRTPAGVFSILSKSRWHRSNIYSGAPMPYMQRLTWSGVALHASNSVPKYPASHGCVRLPNSFAPQLFHFTKTGIHVIITNLPDLAPAPIEDAKLFKPSWPAPKDYDVLESERVLAASGVKPGAKEKRSTEPLRILVTKRTGQERLKDVQRLLNEMQFGAGDVDGWMGPDTAQAIRRFEATYGEAYGLTNDGLVTDDLIKALYKAAGRPVPKNGHIYVRQNFKQVFDAPVTILDPQVPLGNHLITAQYFKPGDTNIRWLYLSLDKTPVRKRQEAAAAPDPKTANDGPEIQSPIPVPESTVREALDRVVIPDDARERIDEMLTPGSSLAISDDGLSKETHPKGTDFVLLTD